MITGINYVSLPVQDLAVARRFYEETLELSVRMATKTWLEFQAGPLTLSLYPAEGETRAGEIAFSVTRLDEMVATLKRKGVAFSHGIEAFELPTGKGRLARFSDPSGNKLELVEM